MIPASTQFGNWKTTTSPGPTPLARIAPARDRAARSTSAKVPRQGRTWERTRKLTPAMSPNPPATIAPSESSVHQPSATYVPGQSLRHLSQPPPLRHGAAATPHLPLLVGRTHYDTVRHPLRVALANNENYIIVIAMALSEPTGGGAGTLRDHGFHPLRVVRVIPETAEASSFVFEIPHELRPAFTYEAGQFCNLRVEVDGRSHAPAATPCPRHRRSTSSSRSR